MIKNILLTGASGYIGGSVLVTLLHSKKISIDALRISALVRNDQQVQKMKELGVSPISIRDLDDTEVIQKAAKDHDVVIHTASGFHSSSAKALVLGLADRKKETGQEVHYIHTSGAGNFVKFPITKESTETRKFSDKEDIYSYVKEEEAKSPFIQRTTELLAIDTAVENGVKIYVLSPPTIYGIGIGPFNRHSEQIPKLMKIAMKDRRSTVIGDGTGVWDYVHILDLASLYELLLQKILAGEEIPNGQKGYYFTSAGRGTWLEKAQEIAKAGVSLGLLDTTEVKPCNLEEAEEKFGYPPMFIELAYASSICTNADKARELGWNPTRTVQDYKDSFIVEFKALSESS